jgi:hypothetical protein
MKAHALVLLAVFCSLFMVAIGGRGQSDTAREVGPVLLIDGDRSTEMKYSMASSRGTNTRAGVFSVAKEYLTFGGGKADLRTKDSNPVFEFYADAGFNVPSGIYIFKFDEHKDRRDVRTGKAQVGKSSSGIPKDHFIETTLEELGKGQNSTTHYHMKPATPLRPGEYCLVRSGYSCFDFGVDP